MTDGLAMNRVGDTPEVDMDRINEELGQPSPADDAGVRAAETIRTKAGLAARAKRLFMVTVGFGLAIVVIAIGGGSYTFYENITTRSVTDSRPCKLKIGDQLITGSREYSYPQHESFGLRWLETENVEENTRINIEYTGMTVLGITDGIGWDIPITVADGEKGYQGLPYAQTYVFFMKGSAVAVGYNKLCK